MAEVTITTNQDGHVEKEGNDYIVTDDSSVKHGKRSTSDRVTRAYYKFPMDNVPADATVTNVTLNIVARVWNSWGGGVSRTSDVRSYGTDGSDNPSNDVGVIRYSKCGTGVGSAYASISNSSVARGTTITKDLGANAVTDVQANLGAGNTSTIAMISSDESEGNGDTRESASLERDSDFNANGDEAATLTVTYTLADTALTPNPVTINLDLPAPAIGVDIALTPAVVTINLDIPVVFGAGLDFNLTPDTVIINLDLPIMSLTRPNNPDDISGKVGIGLITRGSVSSIAGDADATPVHLIVQDGTGLKGIGLNKDGSPWLPDDTDLGGQISGAVVNMSELIFPIPTILDELEVFTKSMNETRGDQFEFFILIDGTSRVRPIGGPIKSNGRTTIPISRALGAVHRVMLQVKYVNTDTSGSKTRATPCAITKMQLWGNPIGNDRR